MWNSEIPVNSGIYNVFYRYFYSPPTVHHRGEKFTVISLFITVSVPDRGMPVPERGAPVPNMGNVVPKRGVSVLQYSWGTGIEFNYIFHQNT